METIETMDIDSRSELVSISVTEFGTDSESEAIFPYLKTIHPTLFE